MSPAIVVVAKDVRGVEKRVVIDDSGTSIEAPGRHGCDSLKAFCSTDTKLNLHKMMLRSNTHPSLAQHITHAPYV